MIKRNMVAVVGCLVCVLFSVTACAKADQVREKLAVFLHTTTSDRISQLSEDYEEIVLTPSPGESALRAEVRQLHMQQQRVPRHSDEWFALEEQLRAVEAEIRWTHQWEGRLPGMREQIRDLQALLGLWEEHYRDWEVWKSQNAIFVIRGYALGWRDKDPCIGQWYYYERSREFEPNDSYARSLLMEIEHDKGY